MRKQKFSYLSFVVILTSLFASAIAHAAHEVRVDALWYAMQGDVPKDGTSVVIVGVEPNSRQNVRVGFYEDVAGGSGTTWRASGWMACVLAFLTLGVDLSQYRISFDVAGRIDSSRQRSKTAKVPPRRRQAAGLALPNSARRWSTAPRGSW